MRTTLNLDRKAIEAAMKAAPGKTKTDVINDALREYARRRRLPGLLKVREKARWDGNLDELRERQRVDESSTSGADSGLDLVRDLVGSVAGPRGLSTNQRRLRGYGRRRRRP